MILTPATNSEPRVACDGPGCSLTTKTGDEAFGAWLSVLPPHNGAWSHFCSQRCLRAWADANDDPVLDSCRFAGKGAHICRDSFGSPVRPGVRCFAEARAHLLDMHPELRT